MSKETKAIISSTIIVISVIIGCAVGIRIRDVQTKKRLDSIDKNIQKRPVIEYHYYEDTHRKVGQ